MELLILYVRILCFCYVWTEKKNVYRKTGNGIAFAGKQRYVDISCQNSVFTPAIFNTKLELCQARDNSTYAPITELIVSRRELKHFDFSD